MWKLANALYLAINTIIFNDYKINAIYTLHYKIYMLQYAI